MKESNEQALRIIPSSLIPNENYIVKGPGPEIRKKKSKKIKQGNRADSTGSTPTRRYDIPLLSGSAHVGQLYDGKTDQLLFDRFLWSDITVNQANITSVETDVYIEESIVERASHMSVSASVQLSLFAGLIKISGSASYVNDQIETDEYVRMTFSYHKKGKQVTADSGKSVIDSSMCELGATHVVTEVKYGFNAFMVFESKESDSYSKQDIAGNLDILIKKIPSTEISGTGNIEMTDDEENIANSLTFRFHGDTVIDPPPQTFDESIEVYQSLPAASLENERVVSFSIAPLSDYCSQEDSILNDISNANVESVASMMVDFEQVEKVLRRLKNTNLALDF